MVLINKTSVKKFKIRQDLTCLTSGTQQPSIFDYPKEQEKVIMEIAKEWAASNPEEK